MKLTSNYKITRLLAAIGLLFTLGAVSASAQVIVSLHWNPFGIVYNSGAVDVSSGNSAGVVSATHWNNLEINSDNVNGVFSGLVTSTGASSSITVQQSSTDGWQTGNGATSSSDGNSQLFSGAMKGVSTLTFSGVAAGSYNLFIYFDRDNGSGAGRSFTLGGTTYYATSQQGPAAWTPGSGSFSLANSTDSSNPSLTGNYVEFANVSPVGGSFSLTGNMDLAGAQIVSLSSPSVPEPSTFALMAGGLAMLAGLMRRSRMQA